MIPKLIQKALVLIDVTAQVLEEIDNLEFEGVNVTDYLVNLEELHAGLTLHFAE